MRPRAAFSGLFPQDPARALREGAGLVGLPDGALVFALAAMAEGPLRVVMPDEDEATRLVEALAAALGPGRVALHPADDVQPYEGLSPHPARPAARVAALAALARDPRALVVFTAASLLPLALPPALLAESPVLRRGQRLDPAAFARRLGELGYLSVGRVEDPGTFRARGELLDLWPPGLDGPARVELFDDEIEALRRLDPARQRGGAPLEALHVLPAREEVLGEAALGRARQVLREHVAELDGDAPRRRRELLEDFAAGIRPSGCGAALPALHPLVHALDHGAGAPLVVVDPAACLQALRALHARAHKRYQALAPPDRPLIGPAHRYAGLPDTEARLGAACPVWPPGDLPPGGARVVDLGARDARGLKVVDGSLAVAAAALRERLDAGWRVGFVARGNARADRLRQLLDLHDLPLHDAPGLDPGAWPSGRAVLALGALSRGFLVPATQLAVLSVDELLGEKVHVRAPDRARAGLAQDLAVAWFSQLKEGDLVVHLRHGVGRFKGLRRVDLGHGVEDMVQLEYRGGDLMYLPVHRVDQLSRFSARSDPGEVRLDKLGGETWALRKAKVHDAVLKLAHELLSLQARREVHPGRAHPIDPARLRQLEDGFPYEETPDQAAAIAAVLDDLARERPTDRLIVGDVGFGKTEVALRAAFVVADAGQQVAVLCPTSVLAYQHARTFRRRFEPMGIEVGLLSPFGEPAEQRALARRLRSGELRVVIGTTRLLGRGTRFADLGLVIIDEEHRFGVKQKEALKRLRAEVDTLAMSATPIPRSLHMALSGARGISVIATPPLDRLPVHTLVARKSPERLREDLLRELQRGGQAFYIHNRVASIHAAAAEVARALPEARVGIAHGQMEPRDLEAALLRFVSRQLDVLVCTTIVEAGLDMPEVNTILIDQAQDLGLAQLYQLRGRVGRSHLRGFCTLLVDEGRALTREAMERLRVLQEHTALGSGFAIAAADLELRGAGNLLGDKQHGHIAAVGFDTYVALLEDAMQEARGLVERQRIEPEIELGLPAFLPEAYVPDVEERLGLYKRLSAPRLPAELRAALDAVEDAYGPLPPEAINLGRVLEVKARCRALGVLRLSVLKVRVALELSPASPLTAERLQALARKLPMRFAVADQRLDVRFTPEEGQRIFMFLHWLLGLLEQG